MPDPAARELPLPYHRSGFGDIRVGQRIGEGRTPGSGPETVADAEHVPHTVVVREFQEDRADNVVDAGKARRT